MQRYRTRQLVLILALATGLGEQVAFADPPSWAPAHGRRAKDAQQQHAYTYYPEYGFYYAPESRMWFWLEGDNWRVGASLPGIYQPYANGGVSIELGTERPYEENDAVIERYGKPKKMKGNDKHK